jgi:hypothetical protein
MSDSLVESAERTRSGRLYQYYYNEAMKDGIITTDELSSITRKLTRDLGDSYKATYLAAAMVQDQNTAAVNSATEAYSDLAKGISDSSSTVQDATDQTGTAWESLSDTQKAALEEMGTTQENYTTMSVEDLQAYADEMKKQQEEYEDLLDERLAITQNAFEKIESTIDVSLDKMIDNLESNQELVSTWTDNLAILAENGLDSGFIQVLKDTGVDAAATVANLVDASEDEIIRFNDVFRNGSQVAIDSMLAELGLDTTVNAGSNAISEIADGVEKNKEFTDAAKQQVEDAKTAMATQVIRSNFSTIGSSMIQGMINGMNSLGSSLRSTAESLARSAYNAMRDALDMHSPSKKTMEIGRFFVIGLINGIGELSRNAVEKARELSSGIVGALNFGTIQFPSISNYDTLHSSALQSSTHLDITSASDVKSDAIPNIFNLSVAFTGDNTFSNNMDVEKVATQFGYYFQDKLAANGVK